MALNSYSGFAEGFHQGFGLMEGVKDRRLKEDMFEQQKEQQGLDNLHRTGELDFRKVQETNNQNYRKEDLAMKKRAAENSATLDEIKALTAQLNAEAAGRNALTALEKQQQQNDPNSLEYKKLQAEIDYKTAQTNQQTEVTETAAANRSEYENAVILDNLSKLVAQADRRILTEGEMTKVADYVQVLDGAGRFNVSDIVDPATRRGVDQVRIFMHELAQGRSPELTPALTNTMGQLIGIPKSKSRGMTVDQSFVNAPDWLKNKGYRVVNQGLRSVSMNQDGTLGGNLWVQVENAEGDTQFYFPPYTESRTIGDTTGLNLTYDEAMQAMSGQAYMINSIAPQLEKPVRAARIKAEYGKSTDPSGRKSFDEAAQKMADSIRIGIQGGGSAPTWLQKLDGSYAPATTAGKTLDKAKSLEIRSHVEDYLLFGERNREPSGTSVDEWVNETKQMLTSAPAPQVSNANSLGEIVGDRWNDQNITTLNGFYDVDDQGQLYIPDEKALLEQLVKFNFL